MSRPSSLFSPIPIRTPYGFACKIWVAYQLEKHYLGGLYYVWFARELNPIENGDSSNPLTIYETVDRAVKKRDINHPKLKDFKAGLLDVVNRLIVPRDAALARSVRREILRAPVEMFRPQPMENRSVHDPRSSHSHRPIRIGVGRAVHLRS